MQPSTKKWGQQFDGITSTIYDFDNGYGALHIEGTVTIDIPVDFLPEDAITETGEPATIPTRTITVDKNELHPLELPRFQEPRINYNISPEIPVTTKTLQTELEALRKATD